jgi:hypothetical protein
MRKLSAPAHVELAGYMTHVFVENLQSRETLPIFEKFGLVNLNPEGWYPTNDFLKALNELDSQHSLSSNLIAIGLEVGRTVPLPVQTLEEALRAWDNIYKTVHRGHNGDIGSITLEKVSNTHFKAYLDDLYPDDLSYGIAYGFARRFLPEGTSFTVKYEDKRPRRDTSNVATTILHIQW